jgi:hypothetical protein
MQQTGQKRTGMAVSFVQRIEIKLSSGAESMTSADFSVPGLGMSYQWEFGCAGSRSVAVKYHFPDSIPWDEMCSVSLG